MVTAHPLLVRSNPPAAGTFTASARRWVARGLGRALCHAGAVEDLFSRRAPCEQTSSVRSMRCDKCRREPPAATSTRSTPILHPLLLTAVVMQFPQFHNVLFLHERSTSWGLAVYRGEQLAAAGRSLRLQAPLGMVQRPNSEHLAVGVGTPTKPGAQAATQRAPVRVLAPQLNVALATLVMGPLRQAAAQVGVVARSGGLYQHTMGA